MNDRHSELICPPDPALESRQRLLELARSLDRMGRQTEQFLGQQLQQLADAVQEFENEKAAWRRQLRRESAELSRQREELDELRAGVSTSGSATDTTSRRRAHAESAARRNGEGPLQLIVQPRNATPLQVSVLFFELSKLNRDMGGQGIRFEIADVRLPRKRLLSRQPETDSAWPMFLFHGFPVTPLKARGSHVVLDADNTDRVEQWIAFKSRAFQTQLADGEIRKEFRRYQTVERSPAMWSFIREAVRRPTPESRSVEAAPVSMGTSPLAVPSVDYVRQQVQRLESCFERLSHDTGLAAQIEF